MNESFSGKPWLLLWLVTQYLSVLFIKALISFCFRWPRASTVLEEESLAKPTIIPVDPAPEQLTYRIIDDGTIHRKKKLIDSRGFTYNVKEHGKETTYYYEIGI